MSYEKLKTNFYCVGGRYHSSTISFEGDLIKTRQILLICMCVQWNRKKSLILSDKTIAAKGLGAFFKNLRGFSAKVGK